MFIGNEKVWLFLELVVLVLCGYKVFVLGDIGGVVMVIDLLFK